MSTDLVKYGFVAGELAPSFFGRTDLTKYDLAMAEAYNYFVDYRGGLSSRAGFEFVDYLPDYAQGQRTLELIEPPRLFTYIFEPDVDFNYVGVIAPVNTTDTTDFDHCVIRFVKNGKYVKEPAFTVSSISLANPGVVTTSASHGWSDGDWVAFSYPNTMLELMERTFEIDVLSATTFSLKSLTSGDAIDTTLFTAYTSGSGVARVLTLTSDYAPLHYADMGVEQYHDNIRITHPAYPVRNLIRSDNPLDGTLAADGNVWHIEDEVIGSDTVGPTITGSTHSATGAAQVLFGVTSVYSDGTESILGALYHITGIVNYPATEGSVSITWTQDPLAVYYNVYRSIVSVTEVLSSGTEVGFVSQVKGTKFTDPNIIPDFTRVPPQRYNPFAVQPIVEVNVTSGGAGYTDFTTTVTAGGTGTGFFGRAIVNDAGALVNVEIVDGGHGFAVGLGQTGILTFSGGAGAVAEVTVSDTVGTYPTASCIFQQRQLYGASYDKPTTIWGSQTKRFSNFDVTANLVDSDSLEFTLDTPSFANIRHFIPVQGGLIVTTSDCIWVLNGGGPAEPITPTNAVAIPQTYNGVSKVKPIKIGSDLLYAEGKGHAVRLLSYNEISRVYSGDDRSILSNHLFGQYKEITGWAYQEQPFKVVWATRSDGELLAFTINRAEDIFAWTPCGTRGQFLSVTSILENNSATTDVQIVNDRVYVVTQRFLQGRWRRMIERMALRNIVNVEEAVAVDCGHSMIANRMNGNLNLWQEDGVWYAKTDTGDLLNIPDLIAQFAEVAGLTP